MKALTLHEPWAALVAYGWKEVETRAWYTGYRGPLAIHASTRKPDPTEQSRLTFILANLGQQLPPIASGAVVAICWLAACLPAPLSPMKAGSLKPAFVPKHGWDLEREFGNYEGGRWAWILRDVQRLEHMSPARGYQKLWRWKSPCHHCDEGFARVASSVSKGFVHPDTPMGRVVCGLATIPARPPSAGVSTAPPISSPVAKAGV